MPPSLTTDPAARFKAVEALASFSQTQSSDRVRQLEDGLESVHSEHPLLAPDLRRIKTSQELYVPHTNGSSPSANPDPASAPLVPPDILQLSVTFPFPWSVDLKIRQRIRDALPHRADAQALAEEARRNALWQYNLDPSQTFVDLLIQSVYTTPIAELSPRRLALLLMVLSIGSLVDLSRPLGSLHGEAYHHLARAAVCEIPLMEEPDFDELHALSIMIWYHLVFSDNRKAVGYAWNLMGFVAKLAQGLGLHREGSRLKMIPEESERRRAIFWELLNMDCRMSLSLGRPPSLSLQHVDTKTPTYVESPHVPKDEVLYHEWKNSFFIKCLSPILEVVASVSPVDYKQVLELDARARDFLAPPALNDTGATTRFLVMQRALVASGRDIALLQLHRRFFQEALSGEFTDLHHPHAPSVLATYIGASSLIATIEALFDREPHLSSRFLHFWFNAFSATVTLSMFVCRAPATSLAPYAVQDLDRICRLFRRVATLLPFSAKSLPIMEKLADKARRACAHWHGATALTPPAPPSSSGVALPPAFGGAHSTLARYADEMTFTPPRVPTPQPPAIPIGRDPTSYSWLPDVYRFGTAGVGVEERYRVQEDHVYAPGTLPNYGNKLIGIQPPAQAPEAGQQKQNQQQPSIPFATAQPTPFVPSEPRVAANDSFDFEHGALTAELAETSYMAWF
ncbi:4Fe-4S ferredoxin-type domain-containing protein [Mycena chlorophos]|uniref:4Fe-4S ferredoxin-type domain-containing protein n=1 Tax=Mycena chlorophos TaxID=658473 RepID=A0A8H6SH94_MYCCL|nr:4Fe-4S ferredoxin-type domain-containing protein [Mycena chlorophos]